MTHYIIACSKTWDKQLLSNVREALPKSTVISFITTKDELTIDFLNTIKPRYIFFPHWSYLIPDVIFEAYECIIFHMTDLPFGRGGSPLQNLIARGIHETKISALRCVKALDAGPIYCQMPLSLYGSAQEIYYRATQRIEKMMVQIIQEEPTPIVQQGIPVIFKRRTAQQSEIENFTELEQLFDHIRMLDADGYPPAFLEFDGYRYEFSRASFDGQKILANVVISKGEQDEK